MSATKKWCMAGCFALLCLIMASILIRFSTVQVLVKWRHIDNSFTRMIIADTPDLQPVRSKETIPIKWNELYPFQEATGKSNSTKGSTAATDKVTMQSRIARVQKKISRWTTDYLAGYQRFVEIYGAYENWLHWNITAQKEYNGVVEIEDGQLASYEEREDMSEKIQNVTNLARFCEENQAAFLYVSAPGKIMRGMETYKALDFSNANADAFLSGLKENGVDYIDVRDYMDAEGLTTKDLFFRTDHHWLPETGLWATEIVARYLSEKGLVESAPSLLAPAMWDKEVYKNFFLGSRGKKVTLQRAKPDDITILHPKFPTHLHLEIPSKAITRDGDFDILYNKKELEKVDYYHKNPYGAYSWGDRPYIYIRNEDAVNDKTVLLMKNSFGNVVLPFLSLQFKHTYELDLRHFNGSVEEAIRQKKPDVVIVLYHLENLPGKIDYKAHNSLWDFR